MQFFSNAKVLNMPPTSLLDAGRNTKRYFRKDPSTLVSWIPKLMHFINRTREGPLEKVGKKHHPEAKRERDSPAFPCLSCFLGWSKIGAPKIERISWTSQSQMGRFCGSHSKCVSGANTPLPHKTLFWSDCIWQSSCRLVMFFVSFFFQGVWGKGGNPTSNWPKQ